MVYIFQKKCIQFFMQIFHSILRINAGGAKYFEAIVSFSSATNVKYKELRLQHSLYVETPFTHSSLSHSPKQVPRTLTGRVLSLCKNAVTIFYSSSWLGSVLMKFTIILNR